MNKDKTKYNKPQNAKGEISTAAESYSIRVNPHLIKTAIDQGFITELSFYYFLKFHYKFSRISSAYSPKQRISRLSGLSIPTINKYFDTLHFRGLIRPDRRGWQLATKHNSKIRHRIILNNGVTVSEIKSLLYSKVMQIDGRHQAIYEALKEYIQNRKQVRKLSVKKELNDRSFRPYFSVRYIAKLNRISPATAHKLIRHLNSSGVINTTFDGSEFMTRCNPESVNYLNDSFDYKYVTDCNLYRVKPSQHEFIINPVKVRPITFNRYKRLVKDPQMRKFVDRLNLTLMN